MTSFPNIVALNFFPAWRLPAKSLPVKVFYRKLESEPDFSTKRLPPGPFKLPLIGNLHNLAGSLPHHALRELAQEHGPLMHLQLGEISAVVVSSPLMAQEVMKTHDQIFAQRPELLAPKIVSYNHTDIAFSHGKYWREMRKVCITELLSAKRVSSFSSIREEEVSNLIESIHAASGSPINFTEKMFSLTNIITSRAAFGNECKDKDAIISLIKETISLTSGFDLADLFPSMKFLQVISGMKARLEKIHQETDKILDRIIKDHRKRKPDKGESDMEDLVDVLLRVQGSSSLQCPITSNNIKAVIMDIFSAGTDTSSTTVDWAMAEMLRNPRVMQKAQAEVRQALKGKNRIITETEIQNLTYLKLVIKETLRLHPPAPLLLPRESKESCTISGYEIPVRTKVIVNAYAIGRDPEYWHDPESFIPERFKENSIDFRGTNFQYIPFGAGRRICPGVAFGMANIELPLAELLYHFDWKLPGGIAAEKLDMSEAFGATVGRKKNLYLIATPYAASLEDSSSLAGSMEDLTVV